MKKPAKPSGSKPVRAKPASPKPLAAKEIVSKKITSRKTAATKTSLTKSSAQKPTASDAAARMEKRVIAALENLKAKDIVTLDVRALTGVMDTLIIASGTSSRHVKSLAENAAVDLKKNGYRVYGTEGTEAGEWVLVDFGSIVLHVMQPHIREFYDLERLWTMPATPP